MHTWRVVALAMKAAQGEDQVPDMVRWNMTKNLRLKVLIKYQAEVETYIITVDFTGLRPVFQKIETSPKQNKCPQHASQQLKHCNKLIRTETALMSWLLSICARPPFSHK